MKNNILHTLIILGCLYLCTFMSAVSAQEKNDSMKISKSFLKELENAFSFENERMQSAPIKTLKPQELNREFLQELVEPVNLSPGVTSLNIPGLSSKDLLKESYLWKHGQYGVLRSGAITGLDVNALGSYLRPEEIRIRTMREIADRARKTMDKYYPMSGLPVYGKKDSTILVKKRKRKINNNMKKFILYNLSLFLIIICSCVPENPLTEFQPGNGGFGPGGGMPGEQGGMQSGALIDLDVLSIFTVEFNETPFSEKENIPSDNG